MGKPHRSALDARFRLLSRSTCSSALLHAPNRPPRRRHIPGVGTFRGLGLSQSAIDARPTVGIPCPQDRPPGGSSVHHADRQCGFRREGTIEDYFGYGIIGCGWVSSAHAWGIRCLEAEGVRLMAVSDPDARRAQAIASQFNVPHVLGDYRGLLSRSDIDAVSICLPDFLHKEATVAAAAEGKHVLCEKPLALDVASADEMLAVCGGHGVRLGIVMNHRYARDNIVTKSAIRDGALGTLLAGNVLHSSALTGDPDHRSPWRGRVGLAAGGVLATQAIHFLDLLLWFAGPVASLEAYTSRLTRVGQDYEDTAALVLKLKSGALATLITTNGAPIMNDYEGTRVELHGTAGYISLEGDAVRKWQCERRYTDMKLTLPDVPVPSGELAFGLGHIHEVMDFVRSIRRGAEAPVPGSDGRHLMAVLAAAYESARNGKAVKVEDGESAYSAMPDKESMLSWGPSQ